MSARDPGCEKRRSQLSKPLGSRVPCDGFERGIADAGGRRVQAVSRQCSIWSGNGMVPPAGKACEFLRSDQVIARV